MQVEIDSTSLPVNGNQMIVENENENQENNDNIDLESQDVKDLDKRLTHEDLSLLCDLFYLPFEHGAQGIQVLQEFNWLKSNASFVMNKPKDDTTVSKADVSLLKFEKIFFSIKLIDFICLDRRMAFSCG